MELTDKMKLDIRRLHAFDRHGRFEYTLHENMFASLFPQFNRQVTFGTGKGGLEKWGTKKFTVDFYNPETYEAVEIDGKSHKTEYQKILGSLKLLFLQDKGIKLLRVRNEDVEKLFNEEIERMRPFEGIFSKFFDQLI